MDLQVRLCGMTQNDIDVLSFAAMVVANETAARAEALQGQSTSDETKTTLSKRQV